MQLSITKYMRDCKKTVGSVKNNIVSFFLKNATENYIKPIRAKNMYGPKDLRKSKTMKTIKDKVIRDIRNSFEQTEQYYYKPEKVSEY